MQKVLHSSRTTVKPSEEVVLILCRTQVVWEQCIGVVDNMSAEPQGDRSLVDARFSLNLVEVVTREL